MYSTLNSVRSRVLPTFRPTTLISSRNFSCSSSSSSTTPAPTSSTNLSSIVNRLGGWYPVAGLASAILISKEILVVSEELLLATNFVAVVFGLYVLGADKVNEFVAEKRAEQKQLLDDTADAAIELTKSKMLRHQVKIAEVPLYRSLKQQFNELSKQVVVAKDLKARYAVREATLKRLQDLQTREAAAQAELYDKQVDAAIAFVRSEWAKASPEQQSKYIDLCINIAEQTSTHIDPAQDPIRQILARYIGGNTTPSAPAPASSSNAQQSAQQSNQSNQSKQNNPKKNKK